MFRLLPWSSGIGGNKVMAEDLKMLVTPTPTQRKSPVLDTPSLHKLKRKLADSHEPIAVLDGPPATKRRLDNGDQPPPMEADVKNDRTPSSESATDNTVTLPPSAPSEQGPKSPPRAENSSHSSPDHGDTPHADKHAKAPPKVDIERLRQAIDAQLSLEVLLKHNELRLIDQEIAKCQIALEQLRRCAEIPYPGSSVSGISQSVSNGTGFAVSPSGSGRPPVSPAPWGVTDGPYSRHYARWLLPDPHFDGGEPEPLPGYASMDGRTTRASLGEGGYAGKSRSQRGSVNAKLQALPSGYPPPKDKAGPMIIKRKSDGQLVKLVCLDCRRFDFSSTQGFINHCRIAHGRTFASHDAAAVASGEPVEVDEAGMVVGGTTDSTSSGAPGYVHPLIRSAHAIESARDNQRQSSGEVKQSTKRPPHHASSPVTDSRQKKPGMASPVTPDPSFKASPDTPHLSSLLERRGVGLDLCDLVGDAKTTVDLNAFSSEEESEEEATEGATESGVDRPLQGSRLPARTTMPQAASQRPNSRKGVDKGRSSHKPRQLETSTPARQASYTSPYAPTSASLGALQLDRSQDADMVVDSAENLSPHTVESNQAPSLVSDDDDEYEAPSESESPSPSSSEAGDDNQDFDHIEVEDDEGTATSTTTTETKTDHELASPAKSHANSLSKSLRRGNARKKERMLDSTLVSLNRGKNGRRVSFVSPNASPTKVKKKQHR
ncbi:hypothetical protein VTN77DRAFT_7098 [Rasamsonia byssochlamydoides]|uniref:uncharacterized protein n=1 Tax=Rasamsonia byssochlamydoides TaxID=89139 RepID=UPI0037447CCD